MVLLNEFRGLLTNGYVQLFLWVVVGDIVTGLCKGVFIKDANSTKDYSALLAYASCVLSDHCLSVPKDYESRDVCDRIRLFYIAVYGISIIENLDNWGFQFQTG